VTCGLLVATILQQNSDTPASSLLTKWPLDQGAQGTLSHRLACRVYPLGTLISVNPDMVIICNTMPTFAHHKARAKVLHAAKAQYILPSGRENVRNKLL
jgi:hypothetical protein